ncbi:PAS domain S-box protein [Aphanizomenon flos-aquae CCAP 1446/1C]|uniref:PAS domain S-box protein n=1 Tax=Anabaena sp. PCC 7938 TaxID=1296340 RepID=UPI002030419A|nr:PAS domain S-box protein [Anabaena sp. CCAP 1446/1C]MBY5311022.1 PAS domain S-box protein [Anabaena sp. CCAP 1446/1C]
MEDCYKTNAQLIAELEALRTEVAVLKGEKLSRKTLETLEVSESRQYTILLVDDSESDRMTYHRYLTHNHPHLYQIVEFDHAEDALLWCQQQLPDVILIDYFLPDMDGLEFLQELKQQTGKDRIPAIMITGQGNTEIAVDLFKSGAQDYLEKNRINAASLHQAITNVLHQTQLIQQQEWQQQRQQLITKTALSIRNSLNLEDILNTTVTEIRSILESDGGGRCHRIIIYQFQADGTGLVVKESVSDPAFSILGRVIKEECFPEMWIEPYRQGRSRTINDVNTDPSLTECHREFLVSLMIRANLIVPIIQGEKLWGLLIAHDCTAPRQWKSSDVEFMNQLAIQVGIAIQQASLIEKLQTELTQRQQLTSILEATPDFVGMATPAGKVIWLNPAAKQIMGIADIHDFTVLKSHPQWALDIIQNQGIPTAIEIGSWLGETSILHQDGSQIPVSQLIVAHKSMDGELLFTSTIMRDIREQKLAAIALQEREKQLELFAKYAPAGIAMFDRKMCYVIASQRWVDDYQIESIAAIIGKSHYEIFPEIPDRWRQIHQRCFAGAVEKCEEDLFVRADGLNQWLRWEVRPWYNSNNEICGIIIFSEDITERKQLEQSLKVSEERLRLTLDLTGIGSRDWNLQTHECLWNENLCRIWGLELGKVLPNHTIWLEQIHPDDVEQVEQQLHKALQTQTAYQTEYRIYRKNDGSLDWVMEKANFLYDETGKPVRMLSILLVITERKRVEIELQQLNMQLEQRVAERTAKIAQTNNQLQIELLQREKLERELRNREQLLDGFFNAASQANVGLSILDTNLRFLKINQKLADINGYPVETHLGKSVMELIPEIATKILPLLQTILDTKQPICNWEISSPVPSQPAAIGYWLLSYFPILGEIGNSIAIGSIIIEITERKRLEIEREKLVSIIDTTSDMIATVAFDTQKAEYINKAGRRLLGLADDAPFSNIGIADLHPQWALEIVQNQGIPFAVRNGVWMGETAFLNHEGREIPISQVLIAHTFGSNYTQYISTIARDITKPKQIEATLQESNRRWKSLLENVQLIVIGLDANANVDYANPFFLQLTGYTQSEVLGKNWFNNFLPQSQQNLVEICFQEVIEKNFHPHYQNQILSKSGEELMIAWSNTVLRDPKGSAIGTISIGEDITERYKLERMKAEFVSVVSHELRTPLTSMQAALSLLYEKIIDPSSPEGEVTIEIATEGVDRLVRLVNDILDLERLESGKINLEKRLYNTTDLINTAIDQMQEMANQAGITLNFTALSLQIFADPDRLLQVLINLLSNAIKFSHPDSNVWLTVEAVSSPLLPCSILYVLFKVKDHGRGIPSHSLESIFERFHQVDASDSRSKGGTGLGLAICRNIVQQHGGTIWVESVLGEGSTFYVTLPIEGVSNGD